MFVTMGRGLFAFDVTETCVRYALGVDGNVGADPQFRGLLSYRKLSIKIDQSISSGLQHFR